MSENQRRAALSLHALAPRDQRWVLDRLAPAERAQVTPLLQDLRALNIPPDAGTLPALQAPAPAGTEPRTTPAELARQLAGEAPFIVAACLLDLGADEQQQVLRQLGMGQAQAARDLLRGDLAQAGALRQALRAALQSRRAEARRHGAAHVPAPRWNWRHALPSWARK